MTEQQPQGAPLIDPTIVQAAGTPAPADTPAAPAAKHKPTAAELAPGQFCWGTGRRKSSVARVRIRPGEGNFTINKRTVEDYFVGDHDRQAVRAPLLTTQSERKYDIFVKVSGGGTTGQAGATMMGLARALLVADPETFPSLRDGGYLTRDSRMVERKKYGQKGARKKFQFSKR